MPPAAAEECAVCCSAVRAGGAMVRCPSCDYAACAKCQRAYGKPSCMRCRGTFSRAFVRSALGAKYVRDVYRPFVLERRVQAERNLLPLIQPFVDWELERRRILARRRFADLTPVPPMPTVPSVNVASGFACPVAQCRGFVFGPACGTCKARVCGRCREVLPEGDGPPHACDESTVASIAALHADCKPCPNCRALIHRTHGCNHMRCTACGVHFNYATLHILATSTNHHYDDALIGAAGGQAAAETTGGGAEPCELDLDDGIPRELFSGADDAVLLRLLYDDRDAIRYVVRRKFDDEAVQAKSEKELHELRVRFLLNELDAKKWEARIMAIYDAHDRALAYGGLLRLLMHETKLLQRAAHHGELDRDEVIARVDRLHRMVDANLADIRDQYGGPRIRMRERVLDADAGPVVL